MSQTPLLMPTRRLRPHAVARSLVAVGVVAVMVVLAQATQLFTGVSRGPFAPRHQTLLLRAEEEAAAPEMSEEEKAAAAQAAAIEAAREKMKRERQRIKMARNGVDLDGDKLDNLDLWYQEGILGKGGKPPKGFLRDVILRSYFGTWKESWIDTYGKKRGKYTGPGAQPSETDYETAFENMKKFIKEKKHYIGKDDGQGWTWLVARQIPDGIFFYTTKSVPYGERPLALIKDSDPDEFFDKVDWQRIFIRLHKPNLWGGKAIVFPYPVGPLAQGQRFLRVDQVWPLKK